MSLKILPLSEDHESASEIDTHTIREIIELFIQNDKMSPSSVSNSHSNEILEFTLEIPQIQLKIHYSAQQENPNQTQVHITWPEHLTPINEQAHQSVIMDLIYEICDELPQEIKNSLHVNVHLNTHDIRTEAEFNPDMWSTQWRTPSVNLIYTQLESTTLKYLSQTTSPRATIYLPGCGNGELIGKIQNWSQHQATIIASDINPNEIEHANAAYGNEKTIITLGDVSDKTTWDPIPKSDVVIAGGLFTEAVLSKEQTEKGLQHAQEKVTPGGHLIIYGLGRQRLDHRHFDPQKWTIVQTYDLEHDLPFLVMQKKATH